MSEHLVVLASGGLDSTVLAHYLKKEQKRLTLLSVDYGQKHFKEMDCVLHTVESIGCMMSTVCLSCFALESKSALTNFDKSIPEGHYAADNMAITVVPNRNAIMLSIAWGVACSLDADGVAYAAHSGDHVIYPDCRPEFVNKLSAAFQEGTVGHRKLGMNIYAPFISMTKEGIVKLGHELGVPFEHTWSCYAGRELSCGRCGTCVERLEAFDKNALADPLQYEDREYWREAVKAYNVNSSKVM